MAGKTETRAHQDLLGVYLNDHMAGSVAGLELARRMAAAAEPGSESATVLARLVTEIAQDRAALLEIIVQGLSGHPRPVDREAGGDDRS